MRNRCTPSEEGKSFGETLANALLEVAERTLHKTDDFLSFVSQCKQRNLHEHYARSLPASTAICCPRGNESHMKEGESVGEREGESGAGKFSKVELGNRCDGGGRGPAGMGGGRVLCVRARACV